MLLWAVRTSDDREMFARLSHDLHSERSCPERGRLEGVMTIERDVLVRAAHRMKLHVVRRARTGLQQQAEETASFVSAVVQHPEVVAVPDEAPTFPSSSSIV